MDCNVQSVEYPYTSPRVTPGHTVSWAEGEKEGGTSLQVLPSLHPVVLNLFSWSRCEHKLKVNKACIPISLFSGIKADCTCARAYNLLNFEL